jgi:hypothetical protein
VILLRVLRTGLVVSASVFTLALMICLIDLWLETSHQSEQLSVLGVTARGHGQHGLGITPAVLVWCLAVPMGLTVVAAPWRRQKPGRRERLRPS